MTADRLPTKKMQT